MLKISHNALTQLLYAASMNLKNVTGGCRQHHAIYNVLATEAENNAETLPAFLKHLAIVADEKRGERYAEQITRNFAAYGLPNEVQGSLSREDQRRALLALQFAFTNTLPAHHMNKDEENLATPNNAEVWNFIERVTAIAD